MLAASAALRLPSFDRRELVAVSLPVVLPPVLTAAFTVCRAQLGDQAGYIAGFGIHWATCAALSLALLGRDRVRHLFHDARPRLGRPAIVGAVLLLSPPAGALATRFIPELGNATPAMLATIAAVALANAVLEELLWRGVYVTLWPPNPWLGWVWPAVGFGAWHLAPQVVHPASMGILVFVVASTVLGLSWGWVAYRTRSLRWVAVSHFVTDASGLRNAMYFLGP